MTLPQTLPIPSEPSIASYNYTDIASGIGYVVYYGAKGDNGEYFLTTNKIYSEEIATFTEDTATTQTPTKWIDLDFDVTFNLPRNIKGDVIANIPMGCSADQATSYTEKFYVIVKVIHYDGTTETEIGSGTSIETSLSLATGGTAFAARTHLIKANIANIKHFKKGETLRLTVEGWFYNTAGTVNVTTILGHDPMGRTLDFNNPEMPYLGSGEPTEVRLANEVLGGGTVVDLTTEMIFHIPFIIDL